jgi:3-hydroxybutyryl-CoA dehydrogenase
MERERIFIIGPGRMGLGIALAFALHRFKPIVIDLKSRRGETYATVEGRAKKELLSRVKFLRSVGRIKLPFEEILSRISFVHELAKCQFEHAVIFEAIPEKPDRKIALFKDLSPHLHDDTIVASTTSTIDLKTLKKGIGRPENLLITHWLNPAFIIPLVEIARTEETDRTAVERMKILLQSIGKVPVVLNDSPGFIVPRIQALAMNEAAHLLEEGVATAEDIDTAIKYGLGFRLSVFGLLEFIDLGGLDILYYADEFLYSAFKAEKFRTPGLIQEKMKKGEVGPRAGKGIFSYEDVNVERLFEERYRQLLTALNLLGKRGRGL